LKWKPNAAAETPFDALRNISLLLLISMTCFCAFQGSEQIYPILTCFQTLAATKIGELEEQYAKAIAQLKLQVGLHFSSA
jgi:hypothetical protein